MSDISKKIDAQRREMPEPYEGNRPIPWLVILIVASIFAWAIGYIAYTHQSNPPAYGDRRSAADFIAASPAGGALDGAQIYASHCVACHQATGLGLPGVFPPLAASEWVTGPGELAIQIVLHGVSGSLTVGGTTYNGQMPAFKDKLKDEEIAAVLSYVRGSFGNSAGKVDAASVAAGRAATKSQAQPWNGEAELKTLK